MPASLFSFIIALLSAEQTAEGPQRPVLQRLDRTFRFAQPGRGLRVAHAFAELADNHQPLILGQFLQCAGEAAPAPLVRSAC